MFRQVSAGAGLQERLRNRRATDRDPCQRPNRRRGSTGTGGGSSSSVSEDEGGVGGDGVGDGGNRL
eukprot:1512474-Alexandrium_andersonii.AAC.1